MNNETSFKQHKERFIIVAGVKEWESVPFGVTGQFVGPWFVGSVCEASSSVFFSDGFQVESVAVMWERSVCAAGSWLSDVVRSAKRDNKNSSWEEEGINALCLLIGQWVTESLGGGIDSTVSVIVPMPLTRRVLPLTSRTPGFCQLQGLHIDPVTSVTLPCVQRACWVPFVPARSTS